MPPSSTSSSPSPPTVVMSAAALQGLETNARAALAQVAQDREATFDRALTFLHSCHTAFYAAISTIRELQQEKDACELRLITCETFISSSVDFVARTEDTRRFLVNRVRCAAWERKSHFHLTAIDHMLGNIQPALFDVASMLRGHLRICAMARSAMSNQHTTQTNITRELEVKDLTYQRLKRLHDELEEYHCKLEEYKLILRDMKSVIGSELERFIERKKRRKQLQLQESKITEQQQQQQKKSDTSSQVKFIPASSSCPSTSFLSAMAPTSAASHTIIISPAPRSISSSSAIALPPTALALTPPRVPMTRTSSAASAAAAAFAYLHPGASSSSSSSSSSAQTVKETGFGQLRLSSPIIDETLMLGGDALDQDEEQLRTSRTISGTPTAPMNISALTGLNSTLNDSSSSSDSASAQSQALSPLSPTGSSPLSQSHSATLSVSGNTSWYSLSPPRSPERSHARMNSSPPRSLSSSPTGTNMNGPSPQASPPRSRGSSGGLSASNSGSSGTSPPFSSSAMWPSAPSGPQSILVTSLLASDTWPDELDEIASWHVESLKHPQEKGRSSHGVSRSASGTANISPSKSSSQQRGLKVTLTPPLSPTASSFNSPTASSRNPPLHPVVSPPASSKLLKSPSTPAMSSTRARSSSTGERKDHRGHHKSASSTSANLHAQRQGYLNIKMKYFQSLGSKSGANAEDPSSSASAGQVGTGAWTKHLPSSSSSSAISSNKLAVSTPTSPSSPILPLMSPSSVVVPSSPAAAPTVRPRALFARDSPLAEENKRWLLRALPKNTSFVEEKSGGLADDPELLPLRDENIHQIAAATPATPSITATSPSAATAVATPTTPTTPSSNVATPSSSSPSAQKKVSWWSNLFNRKPSASMSAALSEQAGTPVSTAKEPSSRATSASVVVAPSSSPTSASTALVTPLPSSSSSAASTRLLDEWATLAQLYDEIKDHARAQQRAWEELESVLDRRERIAAEERKRAREVREEAERREKERMQKELEMKTALPTLVISTNINSSSSGTKSKSPTSSLGPSSHALSSFSSSGGHTHPSQYQSDSIVQEEVAPPHPRATTPPSSSSRKTVRARLQSISGPTLMSPDETSKIIAASASASNLSNSSGSSEIIEISNGALQALRTALVEHLSRSASVPNSPVFLDAPSSNPHHARRSSDSETHSSTTYNAHSHSAPPTLRSNSFDEMTYQRYEERNRFNHSPPSPLVF